MKTRGRILICISAIFLFVVACEPYQLPRKAPTQVPEAEPSSQAAESAETEVVEVAEVEAASEVVPPSLDLPEGGVGLAAGTLALSGSGEPGTEIQVLVNEQVVDAADVGSSGRWSLEITVVEAGDHRLQVQTMDAAGNVLSESEPVTLSLAPAETLATAPELPGPSEPPNLVFPADGADVLVGSLTVVGFVEAGAEVELLDGTAVLGMAEANADGEWVYTFEPAEGDLQLAARLVGNEAALSDPVRVRVTSDKDSVDCDFSNPGLNRGDTYIVGTCDTLNEIGQDLGLDLEALIEANPQLDPEFDLIFPGQILNLPQ